MARTSHSPTSLVSPYGLIGAHGVSSVTRAPSRAAAGMPYTAAEDEKTNDATPASVTADSRVRRPSTFSR